MAIVIEGKTTCVLCDKKIQKAKDIKAFPAFLKEDHNFFRFSDSVFHLKCFKNWQVHKEFETLFNTLTKEKSKIKKPPIPPNMTLEEFEKTDAFKTYVERIEHAYTRFTRASIKQD